MKLCHICNSAPHYRESIFQLIDETFNCDGLFGSSMGDIKQMDTSTFRGHVTIVDNKKIKGWYWQPRVVGLLRKPYDKYLIFAETRCLSTWMFSIIARLFFPHKQVYFWSHGFYGKETKIESIIKKLLFRLPNGGTFLYGNYARELMIKEGLNPDKLYVIHNSLAYDKQLALRAVMTEKPIYKNHFGNDSYNLVFIGRLTKIKQLDLLLKSLRKLKEDGNDFNLTLIGDGEERNILESLAKELGIVDNVWFYGACYNEAENAELIYNADLCVSPGNVGLTAMHTMMFGTPVITHNNFPYQMPEFEAIHSGKTGDFFEQGNVDSLSTAISYWFDGPGKKRDDIRQNCYHEIDTQWNPKFQINVLKKHIGIHE